MMAELTNVIRVFISSKQREFVEERQGMTEIVRRLPLLAADAAEEWAPGRDSIEATFLARVRAAPIYVGLFGRVYSSATARESATRPAAALRSRWRSGRAPRWIWVCRCRMAAG